MYYRNTVCFCITGWSIREIKFFLLPQPLAPIIGRVLFGWVIWVLDPLLIQTSFCALRVFWETTGAILAQHILWHQWPQLISAHTSPPPPNCSAASDLQHVCFSVCVHLYLCACHTITSACTCTWVCVCICVYLYVCMYVCMYVCTHAYMCTRQSVWHVYMSDMWTASPL